jgi:hypothetical protein
LPKNQQQQKIEKKVKEQEGTLTVSNNIKRNPPFKICTKPRFIIFYYAENIITTQGTTLK